MLFCFLAVLNFLPMKYFILTILIMTFLQFNSQSQQTGLVEYPELGLAFTIPDGWFGQESEGVYLMGHNTTPGFILIMPHSEKLSVESMLGESRQGINFSDGTYLKPMGEIKKLDESSIGGEFEGLFEYEAARAYLVGMANSYGNGITIISLTSAAAYQAPLYETLARQVKESVVFSQPAQVTDKNVAGSVDDWKNQLAGTKLTFMESYSSGGTYGGGYNMKTEIHLCQAGYFRYFDESLITAGSDYSTASSGGTSKGDGSWEISSAKGFSWLVLNFLDGNRKEYRLEWGPEQKLFLNGERFYRTWEGEHAPNCY
jgi:hypothetical protein